MGRPYSWEHMQLLHPKPPAVNSHPGLCWCGFPPLPLCSRSVNIGLNENLKDCEALQQERGENGTME